MEKLLLHLSIWACCCLFLTQAKPAYDDPSGCGGKPADVIFLMDSSSSVMESDFEKQKDFVSGVISKYQIADDKTRVALINYGGNVQMIYGLGNVQESMTVNTVAQNTFRLGGKTLTERALLKAQEHFQRHQRANVPQIIIVFTSHSEYPSLTKAEARNAQGSGIIMVAVGVGRNTDAEELKSIASKDGYVLQVDNFDLLHRYSEELAMKTCNIQADYPYDNRILPYNGNRRHHPNRLGKDGKPKKLCGGRPADIVFCLDGSSSIWGPDFERQLDFVADMTTVFQVSPNMTKIGVVSFGDTPKMEFALDSYKYEKDVLNAISHIRQMRGGTNTADAIKTTRQRYFNSANIREGVIRMAIIITDGKSSNRKNAVIEAEKLKAEGVHVFAVGVGAKVDEEELLLIASQPSSDYVHRAENYFALKTIRRILALKACKVTLPPTTTTTPEPITACGERRPADIVFSMPPDASAAQAADILSMIGGVSDSLDMGDNAVRVGMVPKECIPIPGIKLSGQLDHSSFMNGFKKEYAAADTDKVIKYMRKKSFTEEFGAREKAQKFGILIVDAASTDFRETAIEATKARKAGIELFVIAIGDGVDNDELKTIASGPLDDHIFRVDSYADLPATVKKLVTLINEACADHVPEIEIFGPDIDDKAGEDEEDTEDEYDYGDYYDYGHYGGYHGTS